MKTLEYLSPTVGFGHFLLDGQRLSAQETSVSRTNLGYVHWEAILAPLWGQKIKVALHKFLLISLLEQ